MSDSSPSRQPAVIDEWTSPANRTTSKISALISFASAAIQKSWILSLFGAPSANGQMLTAATDGTPTWATPSSGGGGGSVPSILTAAGDSARHALTGVVNTQLCLQASDNGIYQCVDSTHLTTDLGWALIGHWNQAPAISGSI